MTALNENDIAVLNYIFDPNITGKYEFNDFIEETDVPEVLENEERLSPESIKAKELEITGVALAEQGDLRRALDVFTEALNVAEQASGYNNRAQAYRLIGDDQRAICDLEKAIELSSSKGRVRCQALCQRGMIYRKQGMDEKARADFNAAAILGSNFANKQLVEMNPYAAMCNQMMRQMLFPK